MNVNRNATIAQVASSVATSDAGSSIKASQAHAVLDIDLGNGHVLHCSLKRVIGPTNV